MTESSSAWVAIEGGCGCGSVRYRLLVQPLIVHGCHCTWCQRETGAAFAVNALIEADQVQLLQGEPLLVNTPSESGNGQNIARCPDCHIAVWSNYAVAGPAMRFIRVGTLDTPARLPPDIHIYTASKQPWVVIPPEAAAVPEQYDRQEVWSKESFGRLQALLPLIMQHREQQTRSGA